LSDPGIGFEHQSTLVQRALDTIARAPIATEELAREVFGLRMAPAGLASRLVFDLLGGDRRVQVDRTGVWSPAAAPEPRTDRRLAEIEFAVVDVETTGGSPARGDRIVEFASVRMRNGRITGGFETLVNPGLSIPRWITGLTGIDNELVEPAPRFGEIADRVREELSGRVFVAHNVGFDWRFVSEELRMSSSEVPTGERLCTMKLARRAVPGLRRRGLDSLARYYGVEIDGRHRAGGDARATATILARMLDEASRGGIETWSDLESWLAGRPFAGSQRPQASGER
jgi:DNA polymerase-3 subunit epsilon